MGKKKVTKPAERKIYRYRFDARRMGHVEGMFVSDEAQMKELFGEPRRIYFGEILGKHSEIAFDNVDTTDFEVVSASPEIVAWFEANVGSTGYDPREYLDEEDDEESEEGGDEDDGDDE